ncbi:MAG: hypothetical protein GY950_25640 [bacterium]|nr:hypothetical protein [bacterium]
MKRIRITYPGAYHHVMNRGYDGNPIFAGSKFKSRFLDYLEDSVSKTKIRLLAYCVMDTHYHLVLENSSGRMSDCLRLLNGQYGMFYRKTEGGKGYVFQSRFVSTLIENDAYLIQSLLYLLRNPVRAGIVQSAENYTWSSAQYYYSERKPGIVDVKFVSELFGTEEEFRSALHALESRQPSVIVTKYGEVLGGDDFMESALKKYNRRNSPSHQSKGIQRKDELCFDPVEKIVWEFERMNGIKIAEIDPRTLKGKRQRGALLVHLKERAGLKYKEIGKFDVFGDLSFASLRSLYRSMRGKRNF